MSYIWPYTIWLTIHLPAELRAHTTTKQKVWRFSMKSSQIQTHYFHFLKKRNPGIPSSSCVIKQKERHNYKWFRYYIPSAGQGQSQRWGPEQGQVTRTSEPGGLVALLTHHLPSLDGPPDVWCPRGCRRVSNRVDQHLWDTQIINAIQCYWATMNNLRLLIFFPNRGLCSWVKISSSRII